MNSLKIVFITTILFFIFSLHLNAQVIYTIKTNSLSEAIQQISNISKLPFIVDTDILQNKQSNTIQGVQTLEETLALIFKDTGLKAIINNDTIVIKKTPYISQQYQQDKVLNDILIIGNQTSYYDEYSNTAMKGEFRDIETPYSTSVVNNILIKDIQALRMEDTYDYTTGVSGTNPRANGIIVRGFELDLENLNMNGMPGLISRFSSPSTSNIEKIEIFKGPASVLYGSMDPGAYINIQTKEFQDKNQINFHSSYSTYMDKDSNIAQNNSYTTSLDILGSVNNISYRIITAAESLQSFRNNIENKNYYVYPSLLWNINDQTSLSLAFEYANENADADEGLAVLDNDIKTIDSIDTVYQEDGDYDNDDGKSLDIRLKHYTKNNSLLNLSLRSVIHKDERELYEMRDVNNDTDTLVRRYRKQHNKRHWHTFDTNYAFLIQNDDITQNITAGLTLSYRMTDFDRINSNDLAGINLYTSSQEETQTGDLRNRRKTKYLSKALYLQNKIDLTNKLTIVGSIRADKTNVVFDCIYGVSSSCIDNKTSSSNLVGSGGLIYSLNHFSSIYTSISQSYFPYTAERIDINGNALDAEESTQIELGLKFNVNQNFNSTLSFYHIDKKNVAQKFLDNIYESIGQVNSKGFEADIQWLMTQNWQAKIGYAYNNSKTTSDGNRYTLVSGNPSNSLFLFTRYNYPKKIFDGLFGISTGISYKDSIYTSSNENTAVKLPSYNKIDIGLYYEKKNWNVSLNIENITNKTYFQYGTDDDEIYPGEPRKITLSYNKTF